MRRPGSGGRVSFLAAVFLALLAPGGASAATVVNGDFESGTLNGWHVHRVTESANWFAYKGTAAPIGSKRANAEPVQAPPQGEYAAITDEAIPDTLILYQDITLDAGESHRLSLLAYYDSYDPIAIPTPDTLSVDDEVLGSQSNQQFRIDVMKPDAPLESVDPADILRTVFQTKLHDPKRLLPTRFTADLTPFAGQTVRLRIANAAHEETFNAGVDDVSISSTTPGQSPSSGSKHGGSVRFGFGKVKLNRHNGTATLPVQIPGPGLLSATGKAIPSSARSPGARRVKRSVRTIKPVSIKAAAAGTVTLHLKPTPSARETLTQKHRLRIKVEVTFRPAGGSAETTTLPVVLRLAPVSPHRH